MNSKQKPNVVFVLTDAQGYGDLGCYGNPVIRTPHLDRMHSESIRLTNYHVGPTCAPTRASLLTGHYANSTDVFAENGYVTGIFGKWRLGDNYPWVLCGHLVQRTAKLHRTAQRSQEIKLPIGMGEVMRESKFQAAFTSIISGQAIIRRHRK